MDFLSSSPASKGAVPADPAAFSVRRTPPDAGIIELSVATAGVWQRPQERS